MWKCCLYFIRIMIDLRPPHPFNLTSLFLTNSLLAYKDYFKTWWQRCVLWNIMFAGSSHMQRIWCKLMIIHANNCLRKSLCDLTFHKTMALPNFKSTCKIPTQTHTHVFLCNNFMMHLPLFLRFLWYDYVA